MAGGAGVGDAFLLVAGAAIGHLREVAGPVVRRGVAGEAGDADVGVGAVAELDVRVARGAGRPGAGPQLRVLAPPRTCRLDRLAVAGEAVVDRGRPRRARVVPVARR